MARVRVLVGVGTIGALVAAGLAVAPVAAEPDRGAPTLRPGFVGVPAGVEVDNPAVTSRTPVVAAARSHVQRYAATLGVDPGQLTLTGVTPTVAGTDAVRFAQEVAGVPVIGGEVVVSVRPDRELASAQATVSSRTKVAAPLVGEDDAADQALAAAAKASGAPAASLTVTRAGRWLLDPVALGAPARLGSHTVWRFDVADGAAVRRTVLVDVRSGAVVMNLDAIQHVDRVVCDKQNLPVPSESDCTRGFARSEGGPASAVDDVNQAYEFSGAVSEFYDEIGGIDLTDELGLSIGGTKRLTSTVRFCYLDLDCPYENAFWNGSGMFYGDGYASADDVVGHEMTHGIIDRSSGLFYWGQSGAINESLADIMGEIVDHRNVGPGDSATSWGLGEDLPIGAIRDLEDPGLFGQPDSMTSPDYTADAGYEDSAGVHTNSGVGNKTAYLISQGGSFGGQSIDGIDDGDPGLSKTATLFLLTIQVLSSGSDYADLALVLDGACQQLVGGPEGFTSADCADVHKAGLATKLRTTPTNAPQPADAPLTCPTGTLRVLFDSETGADPATALDGGPTWFRNGDDAAEEPNASSGRESWYSFSPPSVGASTLETASPVALPAGQKSYLWFQHWRLLDFDPNGFYDGGKVRIDGASTDDLPWVNGPEQVLSTLYGNPAGGTEAFGGDSRGWVASRVDLSSYAGQSVSPGFTMYTDNSVSYPGWYVDDVTVYTCDPGIANTKRPTVGGQARVGKTLTAKPGSWTPAGVSFSYVWLRSGSAIRGATKQTYVLKSADRGKKIAVKVTGQVGGLDPVTVTSKAVGPVRG